MLCLIHNKSLDTKEQKMSFSEDMITTIKDFQSLANKALVLYEQETKAQKEISEIQTSNKYTPKGLEEMTGFKRRKIEEIHHRLKAVIDEALKKTSELDKRFLMYVEMIEYSEEFRQIKALIEATQPTPAEVVGLATKYRDNYTVIRLLLAYIEKSEFSARDKKDTKSEITLLGANNRKLTVKAYTDELKVVNSYIFETRRARREKVAQLKKFIPQYQILLDSAKKEIF